MVARLGELPFARNRPSSEATWTPGIAATFCEQRASTGPARSEKATASRAAKDSRRVIKASTRMMRSAFNASQASCRAGKSENVDDSGFVRRHGSYGLDTRPESLLDGVRGTVPRSDPHNTGGILAKGQPQSAEVGILGDHDVVMLARELRNHIVIGAPPSRAHGHGLSRERRRPIGEPRKGWDSRRTGASRGLWRCPSFTLSFCRVGKTSKDVFPFQVGEIGKDFLDAHVGGQIFQHVGHRDAHAARTRLSAELARFDGNAGSPVGHGLNLRQERYFNTLPSQ